MTDTKDNAPIEVTVSGGRVLTVATGFVGKTGADEYKEADHGPGAKLELPAAEAKRLAALGYVTLPAPPGESEAPPAEGSARAKAGPTISPKDGPRVTR